MFTLSLGLTTPYSLGILVWNFYQSFVTVPTEFWLRFEPQIRTTGFVINFLFITARAEMKVPLCVKLFDFFSWVNTHPFDQKFCRFLSQIQSRILHGISEKTISGEFFINFIEN